MRIMRVPNVNAALMTAVGMMRDPVGWYQIAPRDGNVTREYAEPVTTVYTRPWQRVLFCPIRDANPFFHLMESLWMLAGRRDADWISMFSSNIGQFAEDDGYFHGAYGYRWRSHFHVSEWETMDQLMELIGHLKRLPDSRRAVLGMWDPSVDLDADKRDIPCNTHVYFKVRNQYLNMLVSCRSNDIIWGAYGANAVHFSVLQEYVAAALEIKVGVYTHVSDSWHYYIDNPFAKRVTDMIGEYSPPLYYSGIGADTARMGTLALVNGSFASWNNDLRKFVDDTNWDVAGNYRDLFFRSVALPMRRAWDLYKGEHDVESALDAATFIAAPDWKRACIEWLERRVEVKA